MIHHSSTYSKTGVSRRTHRRLAQHCRETLTASYWDVEQPTHHECGEFSLRRNLRLPQRPNPILIRVTTVFDDQDQLNEFIDAATEHYGSRAVLLYVECEATELDDKEHLNYEDLALATAIGNIVSFHGKSGGSRIFRLRMTHAGNTFETLSDNNGARSFERPQPTRLENKPTPEVRDRDAILEGTLTAWKFHHDEPHKEYGWIEDDDGNKYNAYWRAFANEDDLEHVRDLAEENRDAGSWAEFELTVRFRVGPPQRNGQHPRAVEISVD